MGFFTNFKDKVNEKLFIRDEEYDEDETANEVGYAAEEETAEEDGNGIVPPAYNSYSYSPTGGMDAPEYEFASKESYSQGAEFKFSRPAASAAAPEYKAPTEKKGANIYNMSSIRTANKFKLNSITLRDIYGAKDVALLMMEKDTIILVDFSMLDDEQRIRAMDFIDGARCVTNAIFGRLNENIIVFVPENVELRGDFHSQVDFDSIK